MPPFAARLWPDKPPTNLLTPGSVSSSVSGAGSSDSYDWNGTVLNLAGAKNLNALVSAEVSAKKVRIDNIIVSEDWAGVHAWMSVHRPDGSADAFDTMAFYHFVKSGDGILKVDKCWIKENIL